MAKIDDIDLDSRGTPEKHEHQSVPKLSKKINVNSSVVYSRIKRLDKKQLIKRFTIEVNDSALGYTVSAMIGMNMTRKSESRYSRRCFEWTRFAISTKLPEGSISSSK